MGSFGVAGHRVAARRSDIGAGHTGAQDGLGFQQSGKGQQQGGARAQVQAINVSRAWTNQQRSQRAEDRADDDSRVAAGDESHSQSDQRAHTAVDDRKDDASHADASRAASIVLISTRPPQPYKTGSRRSGG